VGVFSLACRGCSCFSLPRVDVYGIAKTNRGREQLANHYLRILCEKAGFRRAFPFLSGNGKVIDIFVITRENPNNFFFLLNARIVGILAGMVR
jgi:hypothetical protein